MENNYKNISNYSLRLNLLLFFIILFVNVEAQQTTKKSNTSINKNLKEIPTLSEIIPQVAQLKDKYAVLENSVEHYVNVSKINEKNQNISNKLTLIIAEFNDLKKEGQINTSELTNLKEEVEQLGKSFNEINKSLATAIEAIEKSRKNWFEYQKKWSTYDSIFSTKELPPKAQLALQEANIIIKKGLANEVEELNSLLKLQQNCYNNQSTINDLSYQISLLRQKRIVDLFENGSIPMYSPEFYAQFNAELWSNFKKGFSKIILPNENYFQNYWWRFFLQILITLITIYILRKYNNALKTNTEYYYLYNRSISTGIFFGLALLLVFNVETKTAPIIKLLNLIIGGIAFCRIISNKKIEFWKKEFVYALYSIILITGFFQVFNTPEPIFRVFILLISIIGFFKIYSWNKKNKLTARSKIYYWIFRILSIYLFIIVISQIIGKEILALYMYDALLKTIMILAFGYIFIKIINVGIYAGIKKISKGNENISDELIDKTVNRIITIVSLLVVMLVLFPRILVYWDVYDSITEAYIKLMDFGFEFRKVKVSLGILLTSISIIYGSFVLSTINEMVLMNTNLDNTLDKGTRLSIARLLRYLLLFVGFLIAISVIGFNLTNFTIVLSALSVGIGFGLQGLVNNFVSGLILLFERPIREGDTVEVEGNWSEVKKIGLRSTTVHTFDQSDIIIPNADLVYNKVTNWTLSNRQKRIKIPIGVAYGSNVNLVIKILKEIGASHNELDKNTEPIVLLMDFTDNTLNFELRVRANDTKKQMQIQSDLRQEINKKFRENNIEIAIPQRGLHIRSIDEKAILKTSEDNLK